MTESELREAARKIVADAMANQGKNSEDADVLLAMEVLRLPVWDRATNPCVGSAA